LHRHLHVEAAAEGADQADRQGELARSNSVRSVRCEDLHLGGEHLQQVPMPAL